jgi:Ca-activated chloride channel family protein
VAPRSDDVGNGFRRKSQQVGGSTGSKRAVAAYLVCLACVQTTIVAAAPTESIHEQINAAIALVNQQKIDLAIDAFSRITGANGLLLDHLNYNKGVAYYRKGDFDAAQKLFEQAARSDDSQVASKARFNLGNSHYSRALTLAASQPPSAIAALKSAVDSYRSSLRLDADNADARANIEIAQKLIQQLEQQQQQQDKQASNPQQEQQSPGQNSNDEAQQKQQPSDQSHQSEDHQDQPREDQSGEQEQNRADENSEPKRDDLSGGQNGQQQEKEGETQTGDESLDRNDNRPQQTDEHDPASDQTPDSQRQNVDQESQPDNSRAGEQTDAQADQLNQPPDSQSAPQSNEQVDRQNSAERPKTERDDRKQPPAAVEKRNEGKPETPLGELKSINPDNDSLKEDNPQAIHGATRMTNEEAMKLLQSIRDRDLLRRLLQKQKERARRVPVEKDW